MRVPEAATAGKAKVRLSIPAWHGTQVAPTTGQVSIEDPVRASQSPEVVPFGLRAHRHIEAPKRVETWGVCPPGSSPVLIAMPRCGPVVEVVYRGTVDHQAVHNIVRKIVQVNPPIPSVHVAGRPGVIEVVSSLPGKLTC